MSAGSDSQKAKHPQVIHKKILEHVVPRMITVGLLVHVINRWVRREAVVPLMREVVVVVTRPSMSGGLHGVAFRIPWDDVRRFDGNGGILPDHEQTERTSARSGDGSDVGECGPSGWHH